jgi:formylglycine-generating enzyme required for sulfatase activity
MRSDVPVIDPSADPQDVFEIVGEAPTLELVRNGNALHSADSFAVLSPPQGVTSADFELVNPPPPMPPRVIPKPTPPPATASPPLTGHTSRGPRTAETRRGKLREQKSKLKSAPVAEAKPQSADGKPTLPAGFTAIPGSGISKLGWPLRIRCDKDDSEMAYVPGGAATLGHDGDPPESNPALSVVLDSFYMDVTEVTLAHYEQFRQSMKEEKGHDIVAVPRNATSPPNFPVVGISLVQAQFYARWTGKEIPTEAEWERAARGEGAFAHPWGNGRAIWKQARTRREIGPVRSFPTDKSPFGIFDMAGNAREWCTDRYSPTAFAEAASDSPSQLRNWKGPHAYAQPNVHVVKGNGPHWDAWYRVGVSNSAHPADIGFRCVLRLPEKEH